MATLLMYNCIKLTNLLVFHGIFYVHFYVHYRFIQQKIIMQYYPLFTQSETQEWIRVLTAHVSCIYHIYSNKVKADIADISVMRLSAS